MKIRTYKFKDLPQSAKEKLIEENRGINIHYEWYYPEYEHAKSVAEVLGIDIDRIYFTGFWSQGSGASFTGRVRYNKDMLKQIKKVTNDEEILRIAKEIHRLQRKTCYTTYITVDRRGYYYHEKSMVISEIRSDKGNPYELEHDWLEVFADFSLWIYKNLERTYDFLISDASVIEALEDNEYVLLEDMNAVVV